MTTHIFVNKDLICFTYGVRVKNSTCLVAAFILQEDAFEFIKRWDFMDYELVTIVGE
jgi:hypothetical protein